MEVIVPSSVHQSSMTEKLGSLEKREDTEIPNLSQASLQDDLNNGIGTFSALDKISANLSPPATGDEKSFNVIGKELTKVGDGEMGPSMTTNLNGEVKVQKKIETTIGEMSSGTSAADNTNTPSKKNKRKRKKMNDDPDKGDILSTHESTQGLSMTKVLGVESNGTGLGKIATPDANMVSNGDNTEVASGNIGESETLNLNVNVKNKKKKKKKLESENKQRTSGENLNTQYLQNSEAAKGATVSSTTSTDNPASKKQKKKIETTIGEMSSGTSAADNTNTSSKKKRMKENLGSLEKREDTAIPKSKPEAHFSTLSTKASFQDDLYNGIGTFPALDKIRAILRSPTRNEERFNFKGKKLRKLGNGEMGSTIGTFPALEKIRAILRSPTRNERRFNFKGKKLTKVGDGEMGSSVTTNHNSMTENDNGNGAVNLTKSNPEAQFNNLSQASLQDDLFNGIGTFSALDKISANLSPPATGDEKSLNVLGKELTKVGDGEMGSSMTTNLNGDVKVQKKIETTIGEMSSGTSAADNTDTPSKKNKRKRKKMNDDPDKGDILSTHESTHGLSMTKALGVGSNGTGSGKIATPDANMVSNGDHTEVVSGNIGESETLNPNVNVKNKKKKKLESENKQPTSGENLNPQYLHNLEAGKGAMGSSTTSTDKPASKKQKKQKLNTVGDILSTHESIQEGLSTTKVLEVMSGETDSDKNATSDANMVLKGDHTVAVNGKMQENGTSNPDVDGKAKNKRKRKSKNKRPTSGENLNPQSMENLEAAKHEMDSGTTATENPGSEMQMRQKISTNPDLADISSTHESKQEGSSSAKVVKVKTGEMVSGKTTTSDANMVFKREDLTEVVNGKMVESENTNLNVNSNVKQENMLKSKNTWPTLAEILYPQYLLRLKAAEGETGSATTSKDNPASKDQKSQRFNTNPDLGDILSNREGKQEGSSLIKAQEVKISEAVSGKTAISDAKDVLEGEDHTVAVNGKMQEENETSNLNVNGKGKKKKKQRSKNEGPSLGENLNPQDIENFEAAKHERGSGTNKTKVLEVKSGETVSDKNATSDANMVLKGDHTVAVNGKMQENGTSNPDVDGKAKNKRKRKSKNKRPTSGENLNPQSMENLEAAKHEMDSGTTATENPGSEMQMRQKISTNPDLAGISSTHESKQEGSSSAKVVLVKSGEMVSGKTATSDANMVFKREDLTEAANGKMVESENTNLNVNSNVKQENMLKSKNKRPTLAEILYPQYLLRLKAAEGETGSGTTLKDNPASKDQKSRGLNTNPDLGDILSNREGKQEGSSLIKAQEVKIMNKVSSLAEPERDDFQGIVNGEKCLRTIDDAESTMLKSIGFPQVAKSDMLSTTIVPKSAETAYLEIAEANASKELSTKRQKIGVKEMTQVAKVGKKLLILDVNGLLADVVCDRPKDIKADMYIRRRSIFKRPYLDDFLSFCFEKFIVGIWSSRTMRSLNPLVHFLLGDLKKKLLFLWAGSKCTDSGIKTLENKYKGLVVKDLRKIWDKDGPGNSWVKGTFHESNTLLVDDSPYKALLNPKYTGIFPASYSNKNRDDNFLGPNGDLRIYLEGLAAADDVKTYVKQHPFGQGAIDEKSPHWDFYSRVLECLNASEPLTITQTEKSDTYV